MAGYEAYLKSSAKSTALLNVKAKVLSTTMKALSSIGWMVAITAGTKLLGEGIKWLDKNVFNKAKYEAEKLQEMAEKASEAKSNIESLTSSMRDNVKTVNDIKYRYAELSQGVDNLSNKNLSLSTSEYEEFIDLTNQLSEVFPQLNRGIDDNGNAILNLNGDVNTITSSLETLLQVEKDLANQKIADNASEYIKNTLPQLEKSYKVLEKSKTAYESYKNEISSLLGETIILTSSTQQQILSEIGIDTKGKEKSIFDTDGFEYITLELTDQDKNAIKRFYADYVKTTETEIKKSEAELARSNQQLSSMASYWYTSELSLKDQSGKAIYDNLQSADLQNAIQEMLNDINWAELQDKNNWSSEQDMHNSRSLASIYDLKMEILFLVN